MRTFFIVMKIICSILGLIWNAIVGIINWFISLFNGYVRKKNDQIARGVTELKQSTIDNLLPSGTQVENTVISGANKSVRADWIAQIVANSYYQGFPVVVLHEGNSQLHRTISSQLSASDVSFIDQNQPQYEPFYKYSAKEISKFLLDSATPDYDLKKNAIYYVDGMCEFLRCKKIQPTLNSFNKCPHMQLFDKVDGLVLNGTINDTQGQAIKSKLMMGQSEQIKIETLISDLFDQFEPILNKSKNSPKNISMALSANKVLVVDISSSMNNLMLNLLLNQIRHAITKGQRLMFITDGLSSANNEILKRFLSEKSDRCKMVTCGDDVFSTCAGDEKVFGTLVGNCENVVILGHSSGATCTKWAETIGYYDKEEESQTFERGKQRHSPFSLFPGSNTSTSKSYSKKREYIVKPELINRMRTNEVYMYSHLANKLTHTFIV